MAGPSKKKKSLILNFVKDLENFLKSAKSLVTGEGTFGKIQLICSHFRNNGIEKNPSRLTTFNIFEKYRIFDRSDFFENTDFFARPGHCLPSAAV